MLTEEELIKREARLTGQEISLRWMKRHVVDYDRSPESAKRIDDYMKANGLVDFTEENLEKSFQALRAQGVSFIAETPEEELPELPEVPGMADPQIFTVGDINRMPPERYKKLYGTTHAPNLAFRARVNEIFRRAREAK